MPRLLEKLPASMYSEIDLYYESMLEQGYTPTMDDQVIAEYIEQNGITAYYDYMDYRARKPIKLPLDQFIQRRNDLLLDTFSPRKMKPKSNYASEESKFNAMDFCNTPAYALEPLCDFIIGIAPLWESAMGKGNLYNEMVSWGQTVYGTDIQGGVDFFKWQPPEEKFIQVTNPPYGGRLKEKWTRRSYELQMPFALLMPVEFLGTQGLHKLWKQYGQTQHIFFTQRINFDMPIKGLEGPDGWKSSAQFPTCWYCWNLNLPRDNMVYDLKTNDWWVQ